MKAAKVLPPVEYLDECFIYNQVTGNLIWKHRPRKHFVATGPWKVWNIKHAGEVAGSVYLDGYIYVGINRSLYKAHRIVWKLHTGNEPPPTIDHRNGNNADNAWSNLRSATMLEQNWNARFRRNNTSGHLGVYKAKSGRFVAHIRVDHTRYYLGTYESSEEASAVREGLARKLHRDFYRNQESKS